jgi:hypothetical protein
MKAKSNKINKTASINKISATPVISEKITPPKTIGTFLKNSLIMLFIVGIIIIGLDFNGLFDSSEINYHSKRTWEEFYTFTKDKEIDVLLLGNSHIYTGINPQSLSTSLGVNSFIISAPGTHLGDVYYNFKEAIRRCNPKVVVVETYAIKDFDPYVLDGSALSDQIKSFVSRKNFWLKFISTPFLFSPPNYLFAWSSLLRNHSFIFTDPAQIKSNANKIKTIVPAPGEDYKLGKFVRFVTGLGQETLKKYDELGSPVKGQDFKFSKYTKHYLEKIESLASKNNIKLVFLTLPMYKKHIDNYELWKIELNSLIDDNNYAWLDLQDKYDEFKFDENSFENTYEANQHMTYAGSIAASYALAGFLRNELKIPLPQRFLENKWLEIFYGKDSYFENCSVLSNDALGKSLVRNTKYGNLYVKEIVSYNRKGNHVLLVKIDKNLIDESLLSSKKLMIIANANVNGETNRYNIELFKDPSWNPLDHYLYSLFSTDLEVLEVLDVILTN